MRPLLAALLVLSLVAPVWAADEPKPNTLTSKEIAKGWILLFDGETTFGWKALNDSQWTIADGMLAPQNGKVGMLVTTTAFADYELRLEYQREHPGNTGKDVDVWTGTDLQCKSVPKYAIHSLPWMKWGWTEVRFRVEGDEIVQTSFYQSGKLHMAMPLKKGPRKPHHGCIALIGNKVVFRNIKLCPLKTKPIFDGRDLTGWKEYPGKKSRFTVTKEGWLNVKNGPGDLQTTSEWADFVLQLDCRTNGDNLNSGVFFRCIPGQYQNGYEAQIQNQKAKEPKKYTIDEYDPQTHELKSKKKIENWSQDYGTGAIYRRIPARRSVAKDREWFTLTVAAHDRHFATWVNGIQVTDWTDNRPENDNARNGCRLKKGPISLQGHDPTTDLLFRNIRLADLGEKD